MIKSNVITGVAFFLLLMCGGCTFKKADSADDRGGITGDPGLGPDGRVAPSGVPSDSPSGVPVGVRSALDVAPEDWIIESGSRGKAQTTIKSIKPEKVEEIRKNFHVPRLSAITVPEANGFELYEIKGYPELERNIYIQPKVYINTGGGQGQVLGYKTGKKDPVGKDLIEISIPVALVNGLVGNIPTVGGVQSGLGAAVTLPDKYQIPDLNALRARLGKDIATLPVCPKLFRLTFEGREYWAKSPFENLSNCTFNQFFRITFEAVTDEMKRLLETAAVRDGAVGLVTNLSVEFGLPRQIVEVSFKPEDYAVALNQALDAYKVSGRDAHGNLGYAIQDIGEAVTQALFDIARDSGFEPEFSAELFAIVNPLIGNYFGPPYACGAREVCRALLRANTQRVPVRYSWMVSERLAASLETETMTGLGAVANSSEFIAKPAADQFSLVRRPIAFRGRVFKDVISECKDLVAADFPYIPESTNDAKEYFKSYCRALAGNTSEPQENSETDGYYPLGTNTVVYPGAWLKIDLDDISEFTTAKTRALADGRMVIESEVVDLLSKDPAAKRTQCIEGNAVACLEYKTKQIPVRLPSGDPSYSNDPCKKGEAGCDCVVADGTPNGSNEEVCTRKHYQFQDIVDFSCDAKDEYEYCPYWRNQEETVDYEIEYDCQSVKKVSYTTFLCMMGCGEQNEVQCKEHSRKPVKAIRQKLNCREDDPSGTAVREKACRAPKYKCKTWQTSCSRYSVNEAFSIVHEDIVAKWRPFSIQKGEYPKRFEEDIYLKFVSPGQVVTNCRLNRFPREFFGNSIYLKMPSEKNEGLQPCDGPLWNDLNTQELYLPKVYIKNAISYPERRLCGKTEYSFTTRELPITEGEGLVPPQFSFKTETHLGPVRDACRAEDPVQIGSDLWFTEYPPIRFSGRVSVLGRVLESIVTETKP